MRQRVAGSGDKIIKQFLQPMQTQKKPQPSADFPRQYYGDIALRVRCVDPHWALLAAKLALFRSEVPNGSVVKHIRKQRVGPQWHWASRLTRAGSPWPPVFLESTNQRARNSIPRKLIPLSYVGPPQEPQDSLFSRYGSQHTANVPARKTTDIEIILTKSTKTKRTNSTRL